MAKAKTDITKIADNADVATQPVTPAEIAYLPPAPIVIDGKTIEKLTIKEFSLVDMAEAYRVAEVDWHRDQNSRFLKHLMRQRFLRQLVAHGPDGKKSSLSLTQIAMLPRQVGAWAMAAVDMTTVKKDAAVIVDGDGISAPFHFALSSPLCQRTKNGDVLIHELEIQAEYWYQTEDAANEGSKYAQAVALLRNCAKPVTSEVTLIAMTEDLLKQISYEDGAFVVIRALPRFL